MNVLSLFDGMSCGRQALERANIKVDKYFASEIDKHAITVTMANYPDTIQLGSVVNVKGEDLPQIDLLIGGSPCQSFSFAGKRKGMATKDNQEIHTLEHYLQLKSEGFEFEGQSYLFWEYMRLLQEVKPKYFLLENVMMGEKWEKILSKAIGVNPVCINSALVSAQNRQRLYWCNFGIESVDLFGNVNYHIPQPKDKGILLKDILETEVDEKYYLSEKAINSIIKNEDNLQKSNVNPTKSNPLKSPGHACGFYKGASFIEPELITTNDTPKAIMLGRSKNWGNPEKQDGKSYTLCKEQPHGIKTEKRIRRLTPTECERLQTVKDGYTAHVSDSQRYKMLGNGWTVEVIAHIFQYLKNK
jgi:DNA-cytosine methyltransferase